MKTIGVYGSLKRGFYNHEPWGLGAAKLLCHAKIHGAMELIHGSYPMLFVDMESYPHLVREHSLEVYEIDDYTFSAIEQMELNAGYRMVKAKIHDHETYMFVAPKDTTFNPNRFIEAYTLELFK